MAQEASLGALVELGDRRTQVNGIARGVSSAD